MSHARMSAAWPWVAVAATVVGTWMGTSRGASAATGILAVGIVALVFAVLVSGPPRVVLLVVGLVLSGCALCQRALDGMERHSLVEAVTGADEVEIVGTVVGEPRGTRFSVDVLVRVERFKVTARPDPLGELDGESWRALSRTVAITASRPESSALAVLTVGDRVAVRGIATELSDPALRNRHAVALLRRATLTDISGPTGLMATADRVRTWAKRGTSFLGPVDGSLLEGFLLGDTRGVPPEIVAEFRAAGLSHLLAVSGSNVAFVLALVGPLTDRLPITSRVLVGMAVVGFFVVLTRWEPSVLRAAVMAGAAMVASLVGRPASSSRLLAYAIVVLLFLDPFLLHSTAFRLSAAATAGIVALAPGLTRRLPGPRVLREPLAVSLAAQAGVTPVLVATFDGVPALSPVANLLAVPLAEPITVLGLPIALLGGALAPNAAPLASLATAPVGVLVALVRWIASLAARGPGELGTVPAVVTAAVVAAGGLLPERR